MATKKEISDSRDRGVELARIEPRAVSAWINSFGDTPKLCVKLVSGIEISFPVNLIEWPAFATTINIAKVTVTPSGYGLHWESLDFDLAVPPLVASILSPEFIVSESARIRGSAKSPAKSKASQENGKLGGRPKAISID